MRRKRKSLRLPNKYGGVVYLGENRRRPYGARITTGWGKNKRQIYKYLGYFEKREDALSCLADYYNNPYDPIARQTPLNDIWEEWSEKHAENVSKSSMNIYKNAYKKLERYHETPIKDIRASHIQSVIDGEAYSSARIIKILVGLLFSYAVKKEIVEKDISSFLDLPKKERKKKEKVPFTLEEIKEIEKREGELHADMVIVLLYTGLRITELFELKVKNIDFENRLMIGGLKTEAGTDRTIPIHKRILPILQRVKGEVYLFPTPRGKKYLYSNEGLKLNRYLKSLGFNHTIHETRHTFVSQCDRLGINKITLKRIVGHSTKKDITEDIYTHKNTRDLIEAIDTFYY